MIMTCDVLVSGKLQELSLKGFNMTRKSHWDYNYCIYKTNSPGLGECSRGNMGHGQRACEGYEGNEDVMHRFNLQSANAISCIA